MGENAIHGTAEILNRINDYSPRRPLIDGLEYREGLQAVFIRGGVAGNVVPDEAVVTVNHRFAPDRTALQAEGHLRELFAGFDVTVIDVAEGALPGLSLPAAAAFVATTGGVARPKYGWTDVARFTALGIPAVNFGPGDPALAHTPHEFVPIAQLRQVEVQMKAWLAG
jgi:succinyl-diaminopimelate desuccinylase